MAKQAENRQVARSYRRFVESEEPPPCEGNVLEELATLPFWWQRYFADAGRQLKRRRLPLKPTAVVSPQ